MSQEGLIDKLVLEYLEKRGLQQTSRQLKSESQPLSQAMTLQSQKGGSGGVTDLMLYITAEGKPETYSKSFDSLVDWVDNSLDMYKHELEHLLYPIFIHCCLKLVAAQAASEASQLISRYSRRFTTFGGQPSKIRMQEVNELQAVSLPEHLGSSRIAQAMKTRYPVKLCDYSHEVLLHFLQGLRLYLILGIVNDHLKIERISGQPRDVADFSGEEVSLLSGQMGSATASQNLVDLNLNLLRGLPEDKVANLRAAEQAEIVPERNEEGKAYTKKEKAALQRAAAREVEATAAAEATRMEPEIPLLPVSEARLATQMEDIKARVALSSDALPSTIFFTLVNTHQSLNCSTVAPDCSLVAGGFQDASARVFDVERVSQSMPGQSEEEGSDAVTYLHGHSGPIFGLDFSHDQSLLFTASADSTVRLWHLELAACLNVYKGHNYPIWDIAANPHGTYFASGGADRASRIWSVERNQPLRILAGHIADVDAVSWHPNGHYLATGSSDHTVRLWDMRSGEAQRILVGHRASVCALAFHPEGSVMASADEDGAVITWDIAEAKRLQSAQKHKGAVWSLSYSSGSGDLLASGGADYSLRLWDGASKAESSDLALLSTYHTKMTPVYCTRFSPRNLLMGCGALTLGRKRRSKAKD